MIRRLKSLLKRFALERKGAAAVEIALILPFMLSLYVGSIELSDLINVDRRVTVIAATVGDLVARADGNLKQSELTDYFNAAEEIVTPYKTAGLKQLITCVSINATGTTATVEWSKGTGGATEKSAGSTLSLSLLPQAIRDISKGKYVIMSETQYSYKPLMGIIFQTAQTLYRQNFHLPRFGAKVSLVAG